MIAYVLLRPLSHPKGLLSVNLDKLSKVNYQSATKFLRNKTDGRVLAIPDNEQVVEIAKRAVDDGTVELIEGPWLSVTFQDGDSIEFNLDDAEFAFRELNSVGLFHPAYSG